MKNFKGNYFVGLERMQNFEGLREGRKLIMSFVFVSRNLNYEKNKSKNALRGPRGQITRREKMQSNGEKKKVLIKLQNFYLNLQLSCNYFKTKHL